MVTVILPTYNRRQQLPRAVQSVLEQTYRDWELIIVDDGSQDGTGRTVGAFRDRRIRYLYQRHSGVSRARNTGILCSNRPWVSFLDSDDYWHPEKLRRQLEELSRQPLYPVAYTDEIWIRRGKRVNPKKKHRKYGGWIYHHCLPLCIISPSSVMLHRRVLEQVGLFRTDFPVCEDYELWLRVTSRYPVLYLPEKLVVKVGGHGDQLSRSRWGMDNYRLKALQLAYRSGSLTHQQKLWTAGEIVKKARILLPGYAKRGKQQAVRRFRRIIRTWTRRSVWPHPPKG